LPKRGNKGGDLPKRGKRDGFCQRGGIMEREGFRISKSGFGG